MKGGRRRSEPPGAGSGARRGRAAPGLSPSPVPPRRRPPEGKAPGEGGGGRPRPGAAFWCFIPKSWGRCCSLGDRLALGFAVSAGGRAAGCIWQTERVVVHGRTRGSPPRSLLFPLQLPVSSDRTSPPHPACAARGPGGSSEAPISNLGRPRLKDSVDPSLPGTALGLMC